jgi:hypothetical protein
VMCAVYISMSLVTETRGVCGPEDRNRILVRNFLPTYVTRRLSHQKRQL